MQVQEIMTRNAGIVHPNATLRDTARCMRANNIGAMPVGEHDRLIGMVTDRDIVTRGVADEKSPANTTVRQVMSEHVYYCFEDEDVDRAAEIMAEHQVHRLPVLDRNKRLVGILAIADLARAEAEAIGKAMKGISEPTDKPRR
ncbi:MAG TPA: CBS domain-containing protein [Rhizomicrobium sp.]|jgi:CBS domain-containing protein